MKKIELIEAVKELKTMKHYEILELKKYYKEREKTLGKEEKEYLKAIEKEDKIRSQKLVNNLKGLQEDLLKSLF